MSVKLINRAKLIAVLFTLLLLLSVLAAVLYMTNIDKVSEPELTVRKIETMVLPPPPAPPPPPQVTQEIQQISVNTQGSGPSMQMSLLKPEIEIKAEPLQLTLKQPAPNWDQHIEFDLSAFSLSELDSHPRLISQLSGLISLPAKLKRRGIKKVNLVLEVLIDEQGKVDLIAIEQNPYPAMINPIHTLIKRARFTPPQKDGQAARVRFKWPLEISS